METRLIDFHPGEYAPLEAAVLASLEAGERVEVGLDRFDDLDDQGVRSLIALLRRCRTVGGEFSLRANKPQIRSALAAAALERLFPILGGEAAA